MKLLAATILAVVVFLFTRRYSLAAGQVSKRPGALYVLATAVACGAFLVSLIAVEGAATLRARVTDAYSGTGDLRVEAGTDPSGANVVATQVPRLQRPVSDDPAEWLIWQGELRALLARDIYGLDFASSPGRAADLEPARVTEVDGVIRREFSITSSDGASIPVVMLTPAEAALPLPGILVLPGHVKPDESGLAQMVLPVGSYQRSAALELARAGFVTITLELRGFGMLGPPRFPEHRLVAYNAILAGNFYKKLIFHDIKQVLDHFSLQPDVDTSRLGITGVSLGAELAVEYAALDERIKAISFHSHGGRVGPYRPIRHGPAKQPHYCHIIPGANRHMRVEDPFLLLAPRPTQGLRGSRQPFSEVAFAETLRRSWSIMGAPQDIELGNVDGESHVYFVDEAIRFFREYLQAPASKPPAGS